VSGFNPHERKKKENIGLVDSILRRFVDVVESLFFFAFPLPETFQDTNRKKEKHSDKNSCKCRHVVPCFGRNSFSARQCSHPSALGNLLHSSCIMQELNFHLICLAMTPKALRAEASGARSEGKRQTLLLVKRRSSCSQLEFNPPADIWQSWGEEKKPPHRSLRAPTNSIRRRKNEIPPQPNFRHNAHGYPSDMRVARRWGEPTVERIFPFAFPFEIA
jgi:hypothetical protein